VTVSGDEPIVLAGAAMVGLIRAVIALGEAGLGPHAVVGGVAVAARLGQAHRATADVDMVVDETMPPDAITALLQLPDAVRDNDVGYRVWVGGTKIELIPVSPVTDADLDGLTEMQTLFVAAHSFALFTATPVTLVAAADRNVVATAPFATAAALVAMKLGAIQGRRFDERQDKRAGDAWDLYRLLVDLDGDGAIRSALMAAPMPLRHAVRDAVAKVLVYGANRTRGWLRAGDDRMGAVTAEEIRNVALPLLDALR
jgi:hypothetical protein